VPALAALGERWLGLAAKRSLPAWRTDFFRDSEAPSGDAPSPTLPHEGGGSTLHQAQPSSLPRSEATAERGANSLPRSEAAGGGSGRGPSRQSDARDVVLFVDTFTRWFEPENARAALAALSALGYRPIVATSERPLCCGRTFLAEGLVDEARAEQQRLIAALKPYAERGFAIVGLEPSCLFTLKDELAAVIPSADATLIGSRAMLLEEFLAAEQKAGRLDTSKLKPLPQKKALLHGHCHQKAFAAMGAVETVLRLIPELQVETIQSSCCGMAGAFGYEAEHLETSLQMAELSLLPAIRAAAPDTLLVADGTSCRHQIKDGAAREAIHVARVLVAASGRAGR
ncbi:MAG: FAD-binding oxidoreductase, partial [Alphaproteobacteria bacterium]|nr:FAD-binding oxidoreductase [Alphaproteobacteria bacterium]